MISQEVQPLEENLSFNVTETGTNIIIYEGGSNDYETLKNKPAIDTVELYSGTTLADIGISEITNEDIDNMFK